VSCPAGCRGLPGCCGGLRGHHKTVPGASVRADAAVDRFTGQSSWTPCPGQDRSRRWAAPRHRTSHHVPAGLQEREQPRHDGQPPPHRRRRHTARLVPRRHRVQRAALAGLAGALGSDECQHVGDPDLIRRVGHRGEEHLQVIGGRPHRVRPARAPDPGGALRRTQIALIGASSASLVLLAQPIRTAVARSVNLNWILLGLPGRGRGPAAVGE
jgi:hypothetical protein